MLGASAVRRDEVATLSNFHLVIAGIAVVVALAVISASLRMTERAIGRAVEQREAATRFFANELTGLRMLAMSSPSPVPARLYLGIEECFHRTVAMPFSSAEVAAHRRILANCAEMELGRLHAQGGPAMAEKGRGTLKELALLQ